MNMVVGSAALAGASATSIPLAAAADAEPYPVRGELRDAVDALVVAHDALKAAHSEHQASWNRYVAWSKAHPEPRGHKRRTLAKWQKWHDRIYDELGVHAAWDACRKARNSYNRARSDVAMFKPIDANELLFKSCAAALYEDGSQDHLRHNMEGCQMISVSVSWNAVDILRPRQH